MGSAPDAYKKCLKIGSMLSKTYMFLSSTTSCNSSQEFIHLKDINDQYDICNFIYYNNYDEVVGESYGKPMLWIGLYIAVASLLCVLAMTADLFHGFRNKKLWFPSKYFTLNVASIMVITIAMKLPVDLNDPMPGVGDQLAKLTSMPFMMTMMANLMPSLASMGDKELSENVIGMLILVITIIVNILIQVQTGVLYDGFFAYVCVGAMLYLLILLISLALTAPVSKQILEIKYQAAHKMASQAQRTRMSTVEELVQSVRRYYIMAGTCSPQFVMATTPLCSAAGIICISTAAFYFFCLIGSFSGSYYRYFSNCESDYKWSMLVIFLIQSVGIVVGTIALLFRCFAPLSFKLSLKWCKKHTKIFKVERYWIQKLSEWKEFDLVLPLGSLTLKALVHNLNHFVVHICTGIQKVIVVSCKTLALIPIGIVIIGVYCVHCCFLFKAMFFVKPMVSNHDITHEHGRNGVDEDIQNYVLTLENEIELGARTLKKISKSLDPLIQKAEKQQPKNLLKLVERFTGFGGVLSFDSDEVPSLLSIEPPNSWSLSLVTLTCIVVTLPNICKDSVDSLFQSVNEGLQYTLDHVEESLNNDGEAKTVQKVTRILWHEVELTHTWLGNTLQRNNFIGKTPTEILKWFSDKAEEMVLEINKINNEVMFENSREKLIAANSMYRITQTIMLKCQHDDHISQEQLFALLSDMIVSIMVACLTNLPRVIEMKCQGSKIEEREASVRAAAMILGSTKKIIEKLQACELPSLEPDHMPFIDKWRVYLKQSIP